MSKDPESYTPHEVKEIEKSCQRYGETCARGEDKQVMCPWGCGNAEVFEAARKSEGDGKWFHYLKRANIKDPFIECGAGPILDLQDRKNQERQRDE